MNVDTAGHPHGGMKEKVFIGCGDRANRPDPSKTKKKTTPPTRLTIVDLLDSL
jgi:hypothetical protein